MAKTNAVEFFQQVRQEVSRVTWPSRKETVVTTAMVFVMVFIAAAFFFLVDQVFSAGVRLVFGLGPEILGRGKMASRWYVIHVYSGFEKKVATSIREQADQKGLAEKFEEILVPTEEVVEVNRG